jgi:hypothetical protein
VKEDGGLGSQNADCSGNVSYAQKFVWDNAIRKKLLSGLNAEESDRCSNRNSLCRPPVPMMTGSRGQSEERIAPWPRRRR